jgi:hypothetical protein
MRWKSKQARLLVGNIIFIVLNLIYLVILVVFLLRYSSDLSLLESSYAKEIALVIDSAKPGMSIFLSMEDAFEGAKEEGVDPSEIIRINKNRVTVKLSRESKGYSYSFFNSVDTGRYGDGYYAIDKKNQKGYVFNIGGYK